MRRKIEILAIVLAALLMNACTSVQKLKNIKVTSATVESLTPTGLRSLKGTFLLGIDNPAMQFTAEDIYGTIYWKGEEFGDFTVDPITIQGRKSAVYELSAAASVRPEVSLLQLASLLKNYDLADFTADVNVTVKLKSGVGKAIALKGLNLKDLLC
ncbi:MAG: hypothetical protein IJ795_00305 [Bacteroidales bacterium]|nr:hypothetical protein [Bacteroidales bacterium]